MLGYLIKQFSSKRVASLIFALSIFMATTLIIYGLLAAPIADDWMYYNSYRRGFTDYLGVAMNSTGRLFQWIMVFVGYALFGMTAVKIVPVLLFVALCVTIWWFIRTINVLRGGIIIELSVATIISSLILILQPSMFDVYLWLTSSSVYLASIIFMFLNSTLLYKVITEKTRPLFKVMVFILLIIGQTFSEITSIYMIGLVSTILILSILFKKKKYLVPLILALVALIAGLLIVYLSPGSIARRSTAPKFDSSWVFLDSFNGFSQVFSQGNMLWLSGIALLISCICLYLDMKKVKLSSGKIGLIALFLLLSSTYPVFALNNFIQPYVPYRIYALPVVGIILSLLFFAVYIRMMTSKVSNNLVCKCAPVILVLTVLLFVPIFGKEAMRSITRLSLRDSVSRYRDENTPQQLAEGNFPIEIIAAPSLFRGDAEDIGYRQGQWDRNGRNWIANSYLGYFKEGLHYLPAADVVIVNPPPFYMR